LWFGALRFFAKRTDRNTVAMLWRIFSAKRTGLLPNKAAKKGRMMYNGDEEAKNEEKVQ